MEPAGVSTEAHFRTWIAQQDSAGDVARYEWVNGRLFSRMPLGWPHGRIATAMLMSMFEFVTKHRLGHVLGAKQGYQLPNGDIIDPDCAFISTPRFNATPPRNGEFVRAVPEVVLEVLARTSLPLDLSEKASSYTRNGVFEYWQVDPDNRTVRVFAARGGRFDEPRTYSAADVAVSYVLDGFAVPLGELFE